VFEACAVAVTACDVEKVCEAVVDGAQGGGGGLRAGEDADAAWSPERERKTVSGDLAGTLDEALFDAALRAGGLRADA
jgi:hypothetical protein